MHKFCGLMLIVFTLLFITSCTHEKLAETLPEGASYRLLHRWIGDRALDFELVLEPGEEGQEYAILETRDSTPVVRGNSVSAVNKGIARMLQKLQSTNFSWEGSRISLPVVWPQSGADTVKCDIPWRWYGSVWQSTYESTFWEWDRWERELDLMAFNGVNIVLLTEGTELVWWKVWRTMGIRDDEMDEFFYGPAQLNFQQQGIEISWKGNTPRSYFQKKSELQKKIFERVKELGMKTVVPVFSGVVPLELAERFPRANIYYNRGVRPLAILDLKDPLYVEIQNKYWEEYTLTYGKPDMPFCNFFQNPPASFITGSIETEVAKIGTNLHAAFKNQKEIIWNLEPFQLQSEFWDQNLIRLLFKAFPDQTVTGLQNLTLSNNPLWQQRNIPEKIKMIYTFSLNEGGNNHYNQLPVNWAERFFRLRDQERMDGWGIQAEGTGNNSIQYHMLHEIAWNSDSFDPTKCQEDWCNSRYGACKTDLLLAQKLIYESLDKAKESNMQRHYGIQRFVLQQSPGLEWTFYANAGFTNERLRFALQIYLRNYESHKENKLYGFDLMQIANHMLAIESDSLLATAAEKHLVQQPLLRNSMIIKAVENMHQMDRLSFLFEPEKWQSLLSSINYYSNNGDDRRALYASYMEMIDRFSIEKPAYGARLQHGLLNGFYAPRWLLLNDYLNKNSYYHESEFKEKLKDKEKEWIENEMIEAAEEPGDEKGMIEWLKKKYLSVKEPVI
ncbi:MAG: alpha-N-acetylglucosaminidase C-terminal domain-containing protein [Saprospiraceae bacterium]|nr:alpha-N-acetylglucosaminidase C-terminal domain-containing protein [Saprospiraceae bacterium]